MDGSRLICFATQAWLAVRSRRPLKKASCEPWATGGYSNLGKASASRARSEEHQCQVSGYAAEVKKAWNESNINLFGSYSLRFGQAQDE